MAGAGTQTILLVDDEEMVLSVLAKMMEQLGYIALVADSGQAALDLYIAQHADIALVIADLAMPEMDGLTLHEKLREIHSDVKVILLTGYPMGAGMQSERLKGLAGILCKPVTFASLADAIDNALDKQTAE